MTSNKEILDDIGGELIQVIDDRLSSKNFNDTNTASESLKEVATENNLKIKGEHYIGALTKPGRKPGKFPWASGDTKDDHVILRYVRRKGLDFIINAKRIGEKSTAFLIGRSLKQKGNRVFIDPSEGLQLDEVMQLGIDKINKRIPDNMIINLKSEIRTTMEGI